MVTRENGKSDACGRNTKIEEAGKVVYEPNPGGHSERGVVKMVCEAGDGA